MSTFHLPTSLAIGSSILAQSAVPDGRAPWWYPLALQIVALAIIYLQGKKKGKNS